MKSVCFYFLLFSLFQITQCYISQFNQKKTFARECFINSNQLKNERLYWKTETIAGPQNIAYKKLIHDGDNSNSNNNNKKKPILFLHGFGGNADQFRNNMKYFNSNGYNTYSIDLLGYGYSDKPSPKNFDNPNVLYNFETWGNQIVQFVDEIIQEPCVLVCNSVGGIVGLETAIRSTKNIKGLILINVSLRMLHKKKQPKLQIPFTTLLQKLLRNNEIGNYFFKNVATPNTVKNILQQAYANKDSVTDEIVDIILKPGLEPGAVDVFLDFISYSTGPLPEDLIPLINCPLKILWGENDPWEPLKLGQKFANYDTVDEFVVIKDGGHCCMDQDVSIDQVNDEIMKFIIKNSFHE